MAKLPFYTSNTLIEAVKRNISFPISQVTFDEDDILRFADEEMFLEQVPSILQYHEEYFVYNHNVSLVANVSKYDIPSRAIGMKLRDLFYLTTGGQLVEMTRINPDDRSFMQTKGNTFPTPIYYYVENNQVVIVPQVNENVIGSLVFSFYLRPNALVPDERAAVCQSFSKMVTIDNSQLVAGDELDLNGTVLIAGTDFAIGGTSGVTASNLSTAINSLVNSQFTADPTSSVVTIFYEQRSTTITSSNSTGMLVQETITLNTTDVPTDITAGSLVDILQFDGGHTTLKFDVKLAPNSVSLNSLTFPETDLPDNFVIGDYICARYECIVPQIPTDLHMLLGERTSSRILSSLGDKESVKEAQEKIERLEFKQATIIDNRVEGAPLKVVNRSGLLNSAKVKFGRRVR
jgi:hypothetical protein